MRYLLPMFLVLIGLVTAVPAQAYNTTTGWSTQSRTIVLAAERALGHTPVEMPHNNPGYDIRSTDEDGFVYYIEVKGRIEGSDTFSITTNEVTFAQTQGDRHRLALVEVSKSGAEHDQLRYVANAFSQSEPWTSTRSLNEVWRDYWDRGGPPW